ncbi:hypothetical protein [Yersinia similis]|uniref:hypothetical protein n=1 Tax=Yersinia similis TaxID=367190 RepID=UPI0011A197FC|nr:hypothetical protein [Yersinia similis]
MKKKLTKLRTKVHPLAKMECKDTWWLESAGQHIEGFVTHAEVETESIRCRRALYKAFRFVPSPDGQIKRRGEEYWHLANLLDSGSHSMACPIYQRDYYLRMMQENDITYDPNHNRVAVALTFNNLALKSHELESGRLKSDIKRKTKSVMEWLGRNFCSVPVRGVWVMEELTFLEPADTVYWVLKLNLLFPNDKKLIKALRKYMGRDGNSTINEWVTNNPLRKVVHKNPYQLLDAVFNPAWKRAACVIKPGAEFTLVKEEVSRIPDNKLHIVLLLQHELGESLITFDFTPKVKPEDDLDKW